MLGHGRRKLVEYNEVVSLPRIADNHQSGKPVARNQPIVQGREKRLSTPAIKLAEVVIDTSPTLSCQEH